MTWEKSVRDRAGRLGLTLREVAGLAGIDRANLYRVIKTAEPTQAILLRIAMALGSPGYIVRARDGLIIFCGDDEKPGAR